MAVVVSMGLDESCKIRYPGKKTPARVNEATADEVGPKHTIKI